MAGILINILGNFHKLDELKDKANSTSASIKSAFGSHLGKAVFGGLTAGLSFAGVAESIKHTVESGAELADMMARTGAEGKGLVIMQQAFKNAGIEAGNVPVALNRMQKALTGVNEMGEPTSKAFERLGLSMSDFNGLDPVEQFKKIQVAMAGIQDPAMRTRIAMELFGKAGGEMLAVFMDSSAFRIAEEQAGALGSILGPNAEKLHEVAVAFKVVTPAVQALAAEVAVALLPALKSMGETLNEIDFSSVGGGIGDVTTKLSALAGVALSFAEDGPIERGLAKAYDLMGGNNLKDYDKKRAREMAEEWAAEDKDHGKPREVKEERAKNAPAASTFFADDRHKRELADKEKAAKEAEKTAASRAAAGEEYNFEGKILSARLAGDKKRLESLLREKSIREEIKKLEAAGFTRAEAAAPATAKVDAEKQAKKVEAKQKEDVSYRKKVSDMLQGNLESARSKQDSLHFQSTIGAVSSLQRIGGGGGVASSGLDYARQQADIQREILSCIKSINDRTTPDAEE